VICCWANRKGRSRMEVKVIRSQRRHRTVEARLEAGVLVVRVPARISEAELNSLIEKLKAKLQQRQRRRQYQSDTDLEARARELSRRYFGGQLTWQSIRYATNQNRRFGSCTASQGTIRISHRVQSMPAWVQDYVIMHELAHLLEPNHSSAFWELVQRYPKAERARGYLIAVSLESDEQA